MTDKIIDAQTIEVTGGFQKFVHCKFGHDLSVDSQMTRQVLERLAAYGTDLAALLDGRVAGQHVTLDAVFVVRPVAAFWTLELRGLAVQDAQVIAQPDEATIDFAALGTLELDACLADFAPVRAAAFVDALPLLQVLLAGGTVIPYREQ